MSLGLERLLTGEECLLLQDHHSPLPAPLSGDLQPPITLALVVTLPSLSFQKHLHSYAHTYTHKHKIIITFKKEKPGAIGTGEAQNCGIIRYYENIGDID